MIELFTDGACRGNPGPGGYGIILHYKGHRKELSAGFRLTTNNRMELLAVIVGLEQLKKENQDVIVYSDSQYVINAVEKKWLLNWQKRQFKKVKNTDLWLRFSAIYVQHRVRFKWIKGHAGHPENERCDELAVQAAEGRNLSVDQGYEDLVNG